ncbi:hypothetical protein [Acidiferrobacter sp.]|uniref:hypothetical protein n=1 Tax=Acidiferrobacter sp. TaxID=1872107 RepID=UPI002605B4CF|nr:hypothetical protein [Acidiferrobacter sp.]
MPMRHCTCGAQADVRREHRRGPDGHEQVVYRVVCPVCGQVGPAIVASGGDDQAAIARAIEAWDAMIARIHPLADP